MTDCHTNNTRLLARLVSVSGSVVIGGKGVKQFHSAGAVRSRWDQFVSIVSAPAMRYQMYTSNADCGMLRTLLWYRAHLTSLLKCEGNVHMNCIVTADNEVTATLTC